MAAGTILPVITRVQSDGNGFAQLVQDAKRAGDQVRQQFDRDFTEIGRLASQALSIPRNNVGALDLGVGQYREAAANAQAYAIAVREVATASARAAAEVGDTSAETRRYVQAAQAAAREAEEEARALNITAQTHERLQQAINQTASATDRVVQSTRTGTTAQGAVTNSVRASRVAYVQLGQQMQDVVIQAQMGTNAFQIFTQQVPQAAFALSGLGGTVGTVARVMSGPFGAAIFAATALLGPLIANLITGGKAAEDTGSAMSKLSDKLDFSKNSYESLTAVIEEYNKAQDKSTALTYDGIIAGEKAALTNLERAKSILALLDSEEARRASIANTDVDVSTAGLGQAAGTSILRSQIELLEKQLIGAQVAAGNERIKRATDDRYNLEISYQEKLAKLEERRKQNQIDQLTFERESIKITEQKIAALKEFDKANRSSGGSGGAARDARVGDMVALIKQLFPGASITSTTGGKHTKGSDHYAGRAIDFVPAGGMSQYTTAEVERILKDAGVDIRRNAKGTQQLFGPGRAASKPGDHNDHFHVAWQGSPDPDRVAAAQERQAEQAAREAQRLAEFAETAASRVASMRDAFTETPDAIARANSAMATLRDLSTDIDKAITQGLDPKIAEALRAEIEKMKPVVEASLNKPFEDLLKSYRERAAVDELLIQNRVVEAELLSRTIDLEDKQKKLTAEQTANLRGQIVQERLRTSELEKQNELRQREVDLIENTRDNVRDTMQSLSRGGGFGSIGQALKRQFDIIRTNVVDNLFESLFGDFFRDEKDKALGFDKVREASERQVTSINNVSQTLDNMATAVVGATSAFNQRFDAEFGAVNDNGEIVAVGQKLAEKTGDQKAGGPLQMKLGPVTPRDFLATLTTSVADIFLDKGTAEKIGQGIAGGITKSQGAGYGMMAGGLVLGQSNSPLGSAIGGAIGEKVLGKALGKGLEGISKSLGSLGGPLGGIIGGIAGGLIGGLMTSTPRASSTIGGVNGSLGVVSTRGNSAQLRKASSGAAGEAIDSLDRIAEALGATINAANGSVSIGVRKGKYRVDTTGSGITKTSKGAIDFGEDSAAAIRAATLDLIKDGVLEGLRQSTQNLLRQAEDLDSAIQKALDFEGIFTRLKEFKDPVGAALDALDKEFKRLIRISQEAGATEEEMARLEELYGFERIEAMKQAQESFLGSLRDFVKSLETGDNGLSLRSRFTNAQAAYNPLADAIKAGGQVDYDKFTEAAQDYLGIAREMYGSQDAYFKVFNEILGLSKQALADQENVVSIASGRPSPFDTPSIDTVPVVQAVDAQSQMMLTQSSETNALLAQILARLESGGGVQFQTAAPYF